ncbi:Mu-like prophage major head subunit gpT family protein [Pseudoroseicyclus sp. H15]
MLITATALDALRTGFKASFKNGLGRAEDQWKRIATEVPSSTGSNTYGWLGKFPQMREWIGERIIRNLAEHGYTIVNRDFEDTVAVDRNSILDDELGIYGPMFEGLGEAAANLPSKLVFVEALKAGFTNLCYDGQYFFDSDHPVLDENGVAVSVSNTGGGSGAPWFLIDANRVLKPIIFQNRQPFDLVALDRPTDPNVFSRKQFFYGSDGRCNVGYGFWQMAYGSKQPLTAANYAAARAAMGSFKGDYGAPLGIRPTLLVVPPSQESAAMKILNNEMAAGGETNEWKGTAELLVVPWLA